MSSTLLAPFTLPHRTPAAAQAMLRLLRHLQHGTLELQLPDGSHLRVGSGRTDEPHAAISLHNWKVCSAALTRGDIGFAESYMDGDWHSPDLAALVRLFIANRDSLQSLIYGSWWGGLLSRAKHLLNRNSRQGSRKNIHAHYDIGNDFYRLWLDPTMNYSSAWFDGHHDLPMVQGQHAKVKRALQECGVQRGDAVLEIGCGWGALAECAARDFGARVLGVTLSDEQLAWGRARMAQAALSDQVELRLQDYRDIPAQRFDAIVSIEMFEAVGREYWGSFFQTVRDRLKPGGRACIQSITIRDDLFERYANSTDFIQQYIFPGGMLPSVEQFHAQAKQAGLKVVQELRFGPDYAETLRRWRHDFLTQEAALAQQGFDQRFMRLWSFYLAYCEAAFDTGNTDVVQFTLQHA
jgi:cyclopropane-fatty-acyl-phospholipid synthase